MDEIGASQLAHELRSVRELGDDCPDVLDSGCPPQRRRWLGVDRHQPGFDIGIALPGTNQPVGLDGLAAEDSQRRSDDRHAKSSHADECRRAREPGRTFTLPCKRRARSGREGAWVNCRTALTWNSD